MSPSQSQEIQRSLGRLEGLFESMDQKLTENIYQTNVILKGHNNRIDRVEKKQDAIIAKASIITAGVSFGIPMAWELFKKKLGF